VSTLLVWLLTCVIWSTVWLFIKVGVTDLPPMTFAACRLAIALLVLVPATAALRIPVPRTRREWGVIAIGGLLVIAANYATLYWGMQYVSSGLAAVLQATTPGFAMVLAHWLLPDERASVLKIGALFVAVAGVATIFADQLHVGGVYGVAGSAAVLAGGAFVALGYVLMKKYGRRLHPNVITSGQMLTALPLLLMLALILEGNPAAVTWTSRGIVALLYLAILGSVVATWLNYWLLKRIGATKVLVMGIAEVPLAMLMGAAWLGEAVSGRALIGTACVLIGVAILMEVVTMRRSHSP
jgi:drug/metabolite transporter (DMT)-like permease